MADVLVLLVVLAGLVAVGAPWRALGRRVGAPPAVSLLALGVLVGPAAADVLPESWLDRRTTLSAAAFVVLLLRAGLGIAPPTLRAIAAPAVALGVLPVVAEAAAVTALARAFLFDSWTMSALAGCLLAAVSPAVILPAMLAHKDAGRGGPRRVPDLVIGQTIVNAVLAPAAIALALGALARAPGAPEPARAALAWPLAVLGGAALGAAAAVLLRLERLVPRDPARRGRLRVAATALVLLGLAAYFGGGASLWNGVVATLALAAVLRKRLGRDDIPLRDALRRAWGVAEIALFVNLGSAVRLEALADARVVGAGIPLIALALLVRLAVAAALARATALEPAERHIVTLAHLPKATIQAVFGAVPLLAFRQWRPELVPHGETLLVLAVLAIVTTAPLGALVLERRATTLAPRGREPREQPLAELLPECQRVAQIAGLRPGDLSAQLGEVVKEEVVQGPGVVRRQVELHGDLRGRAAIPG